MDKKIRIIRDIYIRRKYVHIYTIKKKVVRYKVPEPLCEHLKLTRYVRMIHCNHEGCLNDVWDKPKVGGGRGGVGAHPLQSWGVGGGGGGHGPSGPPLK